MPYRVEKVHNNLHEDDDATYWNLIKYCWLRYPYLFSLYGWANTSDSPAVV